MKQGSTLLLRATVVGMGLVVLLLFTFMIPAMHQEFPKEFPNLTYLRYPVLIGLIAAAAAFYGALFQALKLLDYIEKNKAFSELSVRALQIIKYCAFVISGIFTAGMPFAYHVADRDDSPGVILIVGVIFIGAPLVIAVFAGVCQKLFQSAIDLKSENDLTV
jgi:uncharacterized membrane protein YbjE (DUF340 family)